jgi:hypothetical protein
MYSFTEKDWNEYSAGVCEEKGREAPGGDKYRGKSFFSVSLSVLISSLQDPCRKGILEVHQG